MNIEAVNDAHALFKNGGYNGTIEDFQSLIATNDEALSDAHKLFINGGYNGTIEDFSTLVGVKKKTKFGFGFRIRGNRYYIGYRTSGTKYAIGFFKW